MLDIVSFFSTCIWLKHLWFEKFSISSVLSFFSPSCFLLYSFYHLFLFIFYFLSCFSSFSFFLNNSLLCLPFFVPLPLLTFFPSSSPFFNSPSQLMDCSQLLPSIHLVQWVRTLEIGLEIMCSNFYLCHCLL